MAEPIIPANSPLFDTNQTHVAAPSGGQLSDGFILNEVPTSALFNWVYNTSGQWITWLTSKMSLFPGYAADSTITIASGVVIPTQGNHAVDTEGAAATDDLTNITATNLNAGRMLILTGVNPARVVVLKNAAGGSGQLHLYGGLDFSLSSADIFITFKRIGNDWYEVSRSAQNAEAPGFVKAYAGSAAPTGYLLCDGTAVSRSIYASLFSAIGANYGSGDGSTTFNVPNAVGRFLRGIATYANANGSGSAASNNATFTGHPYKQTGVKVRLSSGALTGLSTGQDYWTIYIDANTLAFATSLSSALSATKVPLSGANSAIIMQWEDPDASTRINSTVGAGSGAVVGTIQADGFKSHTHGLIAALQNIQDGATTSALKTGSTSLTDPTGGNETRPYNLAVNYVIKT